MSIDKTYPGQLRRELYGAIRTSWFRSGKIVSVLAKIAQYKDAGLIKDIIPLLWAKEEAVFFETVATVALLLQQVSIGNLPELDRELRRSWPYWTGTNVRDGAFMQRLKKSPSWWWTFAVFASHPSGFVRQTALEELAHEEAGGSLPFVLLRTTDWVEPVRVLARNILHRKLGRAVPDQVDRCLPLVFRMRRSLRHQPLQLFEEIEQMGASRHDRVFADHRSHNSSAFLRYRFQLSKQYSGLSLDRLISEAALHADSGPRLLACDWLADTATPQEIRYKYGNILLEDRSPLVRARAFWLIANADPRKFLTQIERALMDPSASVQDTARGAWRMLLQRDALPLYRKYINEARFPSAIVAALRGLRAEGNLQDEAIVRTFLQHNSAKVRKEVLRTLVTWNVSDTPNLLQEGLRSVSPSFSKEAARLLITRRHLISVPVVKELLLSPRHPDSRNVALWLMGKMPKWSSLPLILLSYSISSCRDQALIVFEEWNRHYNRVQSAPSKVEAKEAVEAFGAIAEFPLSKNRALVAVISRLARE